MLDWLKSKLRSNNNIKLQPESSYIVTVSDTELSCKHPNGKIESATWEELQIKETAWDYTTRA